MRRCRWPSTTSLIQRGGAAGRAPSRLQPALGPRRADDRRHDPLLPEEPGEGDQPGALPGGQGAEGAGQVPALQRAGDRQGVVRVRRGALVDADTVDARDQRLGDEQVGQHPLPLMHHAYLVLENSLKGFFPILLGGLICFL